MVGFAVVWNRIVLRRLLGQPLIALIMVTLGLGMVMRGGSALAFRGVSATIPLPLAGESLDVWGIAIPTAKLLAAGIAIVVIAAVTWFFHRSRTGLAMRAVADDQEAAMAAGIDLDRYFSITWALAGVVSVLGGTLWTAASGGGFGLVLLGLRVFPIVVIGGLDSLPGCIVGAMAIGILESLASGYLDPRQSVIFSGLNRRGRPYDPARDGGRGRPPVPLAEQRRKAPERDRAYRARQKGALVPCAS